MNIVNRIKKRIKKDGLPITVYLGCTVIAAKVKKMRAGADQVYQKWIEENESDIYTVEPLNYNPTFSVIVPVYNVKKQQLIECIESVKQQTYKNWQLCLVDDASTIKEVRETLKLYEDVPKIDIHYRKENGHISRTTNDGLEMATGEFIGLLDCDDVLAPNALYEMAKKLNENQAYDFIYSDEDMLSENGQRRYNPVFKSEWAPDTFMSVMYTNHFSIFRRTIANEIGGYRIGFEGSQDYDFVLRFVEKTKHIGHVTKILYHWRSRAESVASNPETKMYAYEAAMKAKKEALDRRGLLGEVEYQSHIYQSRVFYHAEGEPKVSIIIPSKDNFSCIQTCIASIYEKTTYSNFEVVLMDNGSNEENKGKYEEICEKYHCSYYHEPMEFNFSKMCNIGAQKAQGDYYLFLNDDTEVLVNDWLERLTGQAALSHTGAVGAKLYYPEEKRIQHIGIVNRIEGPSHYFCGGKEIMTDYKMQMDCNYSAVTGACLMLSREKFDEIGGFDEQLPVAYNDVDLCFKLVEHGYYNVVRNDVQLIHYESVSRGSDMADTKKMERLKKERDALYQAHPYFNGYDPFFSENMSLIMNMEGLGNLKVQEPEKINLSVTSAMSIHDTAISQFVNVGLFEQLQQIKVEGWFYWKNYKHNNANRCSVVLVSEEGAYRFHTKKMYHDPVETTDYVGNPKLTGFITAVHVEHIPRGKYKVYIEIRKGIFGKKYYLDAEQTITV